MSLKSGGKLSPLPARGEEVCAATSLAPAIANSYLLSDGVEEFSEALHRVSMTEDSDK